MIRHPDLSHLIFTPSLLGGCCESPRGASEECGGTNRSSRPEGNSLVGSDHGIWLILNTQGKGEKDMQLETVTGTTGIGTLHLLLKMRTQHLWDNPKSNEVSP